MNINSCSAHDRSAIIIIYSMSAHLMLSESVYVCIYTWSSSRREWNESATKHTYNTATSASSYDKDNNNDNSGTFAALGSEGLGVAGGGGGGGGAGGWGRGLMPPRWVPDEDNAACAGCGKDFDWARRRVREREGDGPEWGGGGLFDVHLPASWHRLTDLLCVW